MSDFGETYIITSSSGESSYVQFFEKDSTYEASGEQSGDNLSDDEVSEKK